jgi:hypothetical protein
VTHQFHPLRGQRFAVVTCAKAWGEDRVSYINSKGKIDYMPTEWTDLKPPDPFVTLSAGRAFLRVAELTEMHRLIRGLVGEKW